MWPKPSNLLRAALAAAALATTGACSSFTGSAGELALAVERIDGATYLLSHEKLVADGTGEKDRWRLQRIGSHPGDAVLFDAAYSIDWPEAVGGITAFDRSVAAWVVSRHPGRLFRIERLGLDGSRAAWDLERGTGLPSAYRLMVTRPADASVTWLYFAQADLMYNGYYRPLLQIDADGVRVVAEDVVWAHCERTCRYLVDDHGQLLLKDAGGETLVSWTGESEFGLRAVCGAELVTDDTRYAITATAVIATPMPRGFLADLKSPGHLTCRDDVTDWMWMELETRSAYAIDATTAAKRPLFELPYGIRTPLATLVGDGRAILAFDHYRDGNELDSTETLNCDNDRPWAEPCTADYVFFKTSVTTAALKR